MCGKNYLLSALVTLCCLFAFSAKSQEMEWITKTFRITYIERDAKTQSRDTTLVYFPATDKSGIQPGSSGIVLSVGSDDDYSKEIGRYFVYSSDTSGTWGFVISSKESLTDSSYIAKVGDLVTLDVKIPKRNTSNIIFDLETLGIVFFKRDDSKLWNFETLLKRTDKKYYDSIVNICIAECRNAYTREATSANPDSNYRKKIATGRYKGLSVLEILKDANARTLLPFMSLAKDKPTWFRGHSYYIDYVVKWWLNGGAKYSHSEMLDTLLSYKPSSLKFQSFVNENATQIIDNEYVSKWSFIAMNKQDEDKEAAADSILSITYAVSNLLNDRFSKGLHFLAQAQLVQRRLKLQEALNACDSSLKYLTAKQNGHFHTELLLKKGYLYQKLNNIPEAENAFDKAAAIAQDTSNYLEGDTKEVMLGRVYSRKGDMYSSLDEYAKAITSFKTSIQNYQKDKDFSSISKAADVQSSLADVYKKQGAYNDAFDIYTELKESYVKLSDVKKVAGTNDNLGYVLFKQGKYRDAMDKHRKAENVYSILKLNADAAYSLSQIGQAYWNLGSYDSAIQSHTSSIKKSKLATDASREAYSWSKLADLYNLVGQKSKSLAAYDSSSAAYERSEDSVGLVSNLLSVGDVYKTDKQYQKAADYYKKVLNINLKRGTKSSIIDAYYKIGDAAYYFDTAFSRENYQICYDLAKKIDDKSNLLYSSLNLGVLASRRYDYKTSEKFFNEGLQLAIDQKSKSDEAYVYARIADGATQKLEYDTSIVLYNKALNLYDSLGDKSQIPVIYSSIGYSLECKGDFNSSLLYFEKAKQLGYELKNLSSVASALSNMAFVYSLFGEHQKALSCADSALQIFKGLDNRWQIANTYITMATVHSGMGDFNSSVKYNLMSDSLYKLEKDEVSRSTTHNNIGVVYFFQADYDKALSYFMESDRLASRQNTINEGILVTRQNIGEIYLAKKNYTLATKYLLDVNNISRKRNLKRMLGGSSLLLGKVELENNRIETALKYLTEARETSLITNESDRIIEAELSLGKAYSLKNTTQAISFLTSSAKLATKTNSKYLWQVLYELGLSYYSQNNYDSAIVFFKQSVELVENSASKLFGGAEAKKVYAADEKKVDLYNKLVASLAKLKRADEALFYADKSNSQALKEKLEQSGIVTADKEKTEALKKGSELLQKQTAIDQAIAKEKTKPEKERNTQLIASLENVKKVAEEDYLNFINELVQKYPDLNSYFSKTDPSQFRNYIDYIPDSTIVLLYVINDKQLFIFSVTNQETGIKVVDLPEDLNAEATRYLSILKNPENATGTGAITVRATVKDKNVIKGDFKKDATTLYNLLITPIEDQLKDKKSICIIPNSKLSSIPFSTLGYLDVNNQFHFLIENYRLFYTNKMEIFSKPYKAQNIEQSFVVFGNPDKSLPGATQEAKNIAEIFPSATVYLEENATEQRAKEAIKNFSFVHIATHGILDGDDFSKSYLLFNSDEANDGKFSIAEMNGLMKKETSMVFLSACDMAVTKETVKGWYISPINAFLNNRVTTGVGPLWQVPDEATQILLTEFYKNIKYLKMSRTDALRYAQATLSKNPKFSHPYFWGAFVLYGEWR